MASSARTLFQYQNGFESVSKLSSLAEVGEASRFLLHDIANKVTELELTLSSPSGYELTEVKQQVAALRELLRSNQDTSTHAFPVTTVLEKVITAYTTKAKALKTTFIHQVRDLPNSLTLSGSELAFERILTNLLSNAFEAAGTHGRVHLEASCSENLQLLISNSGPLLTSLKLTKALKLADSSKSQTGLHGYGMASITSLLEKEFNGYMTLVPHSKKTTIQVVIPLGTTHTQQ